MPPGPGASSGDAMTDRISRRLDEGDWRLIRNASIFASLNEDDFRSMSGELRCDAFDKGQVLFYEDEPAAAFYLVLEGWVLLLRDKADGSRTVIKILGPGESFAEALVGEGERYPVTAEAASSCRMARFDSARFRALVMANPQIGLSLIAATFRQMRRLVDQIEHLKSWPVERRVARTLLEMCGRTDRDACDFQLPVEQALIAARLSITPYTLSRALKKLDAIGVAASYGRISIRDVGRLRAYAEGK